MHRQQRERVHPHDHLRLRPQPLLQRRPGGWRGGACGGGVATALAQLGSGGRGGARRTPGTAKAGARQASGTQGWLGWRGVLATLGGLSGFPTNFHPRLRAHSSLSWTLPSLLNICSQTLHTERLAPRAPVPSPARTWALLLLPQPTSIPLSFPASLPLLRPPCLSLSPSLSRSPLSQLLLAGPAPQRREGIRASGRAGPGCWAGGGDQQMFAIRRGPRRPRPTPGRGPPHPQLWGRRERGRKTPRSAQAVGEVHSGETLWPFSENSHLLVLPPSFRHPHPGNLVGREGPPPTELPACGEITGDPLDINPSIARK